MTYLTAHGSVYRSDSGGTYRCNDGDPQCEDEDAPTAEELEQAEADWWDSYNEGR